MILKFKEKTVKHDLDFLSTAFIKRTIDRAIEEKVNVVHFEFGNVTKVKFDILIYKDDGPLAKNTKNNR